MLSKQSLLLNTLYTFNNPTTYRGSIMSNLSVFNAIKMSKSIRVERLYNPILDTDGYKYGQWRVIPNTAIKGMAYVESTLTRLDASSLLGVGLWRSNPDADFVTYGNDVRDFGQMYSSRDTFKTITQQIRLLNQGSTNTYMVFQYAYHKLTTEKVAYDNIVIISDNESWSLAHQRGNYSHLLQVANDLATHYKELGIKAPKVFNVDVDPTTCSHLPSSPNTFTIGGMGDYVYDLIKAYSESDTPSTDYWVDSVNKVIIK